MIRPNTRTALPESREGPHTRSENPVTVCAAARVNDVLVATHASVVDKDSAAQCRRGLFLELQFDGECGVVVLVLVIVQKFWFCQKSNENMCQSMMNS